MNIFDTLFWFFFFTLGGRGLINAEILLRTGEEGGNVTVGCDFTFPGSKRIFCREPCEQGDILIETDQATAESGRYSLEYKKESFWTSSVLYVSITKLKKSDAGKYRCGFDRSFLLSSYVEFELTVKKAPISPQPTVTTTQSVSSSTGSFTPPSAPPGGAKTTREARTTTTTGGLLYVGLCLAVMIVVLLAAALILYRKRASKPKDRLVDTLYPNDTDNNRVYEEIREEDGRSTSPPVDVSSLYTSVKYTKPNEAQTADIYSLATAATSQKTDEDASRELIYSEVHSDEAPLGSASRGETDSVIYSVPRAGGPAR
ncbi:uncharacterized protein AB9W97_018262 [Spinachia spinachia]